MRQQRRVERRHAGEDRRPVAPHCRQHRVWGRAIRKQHRGGADRHRKGHRIAESIGEKQLCRREHQVVGRDAEHPRAIGLGRRAQARMDVPHPLRRAGRARRIEPKSDLVRRALGRRGFRPLPTSSDKRDEIAALPIRRADHDPADPGPLHRRPQRLHQRRRDEQRGGAAVLQDVRGDLGRQQRVDRHRHDPGAQCAPESDREIDRVEHDERDAPLALDAGGAQPGSEPRRRRRQLAIGQTPPRVGEGEPVAAALAQMPVDEIIDCVAVALAHRCPQSTLPVPQA